MLQFTRQNLEEGISPGFDSFVGPLTISEEVIDAVANNGQVTNNGVIVVEDEAFANPENVGESGILIDLFGNVRVIGFAPGTEQQTIRDIVTEEIDANDGSPVGGDRNEVNRAFDDFLNGNTTPIEIVEEGGIPNGPARAENTVELDVGRINDAFGLDGNILLAGNEGTVESLGFGEDFVDGARTQVENNGVQTENGFVVVEDDSLFISIDGSGPVEAFALINIEERVILKGSAADELVFGGDIEALQENFATLERDDAALVTRALDQFEDGNFADVELVG